MRVLGGEDTGLESNEGWNLVDELLKYTFKDKTRMYMSDVSSKFTILKISFDNEIILVSSDLYDIIENLSLDKEEDKEEEEEEKNKGFFSKFFQKKKNKKI